MAWHMACFVSISKQPGNFLHQHCSLLTGYIEIYILYRRKKVLNKKNSITSNKKVLFMLYFYTMSLSTPVNELHTTYIVVTHMYMLLTTLTIRTYICMYCYVPSIIYLVYQYIATYAYIYKYITNLQYVLLAYRDIYVTLSTYIHICIINCFIWSLKANNIPFTLSWSILSKARPYSNTTKKCNLCLREKYYITYRPDLSSLNKRGEIISTCRH